MTFRYRESLSKKEINNALQKIDKNLGTTLFVLDSKIKPDGGIIEVKDDDGNWRVSAAEISNYMLSESYFPYLLFLEGSNFLTQIVKVKRPDGRRWDGNAILKIMLEISRTSLKILGSDLFAQLTGKK